MTRTEQIAGNNKRGLWPSLALSLVVFVAMSAPLARTAAAQAAAGGAKPSGGQAPAAPAVGAAPAAGGAKKGAGKGQKKSDDSTAQSQDAYDQGNEDAGDEEMLTGQPSQPSAPQRALTPAEKGPMAELTYSTHLTRTAVWVGDPFHYQIIVDHTPSIDFVLQNLNKDTLIMEPLKVETVSSTSTPMSNGQVRLVIDIGLRSYTVGVPEQPIPQVTLFYFRKEAGGSANGENQAAQSITVPGPTIGLRSTLPTEAADLRDAVTVNGWPSSRWVVDGIGWAALIVLVGGVVWEGSMMVRYRKGRKGPDPRKAMAAINDRWSAAVPMDFSDPERVLEFYGRSYKDLKEYLSYLLEAPTEGLTAEDVQSELGKLAASPEVTERTARVLAACESARYGRNGASVDGELARNVAADMREIFHIGSRA